MNREAVHQRYCIPFKVLEKYENSSITKVRSEGTEVVYDESAIDELSFIVSLLDFGFPWEEIVCYIKMENSGNRCRCVDLLNEKRNNMLEEIHKREQMISRIDYLKYEMQKRLG